MLHQQYHNGFRLLLVALMAPFLMACDSIIHEETKLSQNRIQVQKERVVEEIPVRLLDNNVVAGMATHYERHGDGPLELTVTYDPKSRSNGAMKANNEAARIVKALRRNGVRNVQPGILPVNNPGAESVALITYTSYNALPPKGCDKKMAGFEDGWIEAEEDYRLGCTIDTVFARQIARPKDLKGQGQNDRTTDGRSATNIVDVYRSGAMNEALEAESASGE